MTATIDLPDALLISECELASLLSVSLRTVRRWHTERRGPRRVKLGRATYYRRSSVLEWITKQEGGVE
jgi:predicted DNA-binding transcriptional regulator AlpA